VGNIKSNVFSERIASESRNLATMFLMLQLFVPVTNCSVVTLVTNVTVVPNVTILLPYVTKFVLFVLFVLLQLFGGIMPTIKGVVGYAPNQ